MWSFPQIFGGPCTACAPINALPRLQYASEADAAAWRMTTAPLGIPTPALLPVGAWGALFPRVGFVAFQPSGGEWPAGVSGAQYCRRPGDTAARAGGAYRHQSSRGLDWLYATGLAQADAVLVGGDATCPPVAWDAGATSAKGSYIWIVWSKRVCCVPPPGTCGLTIPALGLHGGNLCPL